MSPTIIANLIRFGVIALQIWVIIRIARRQLSAEAEDLSSPVFDAIVITVAGANIGLNLTIFAGGQPSVPAVTILAVGLAAATIAATIAQNTPATNQWINRKLAGRAN